MIYKVIKRDGSEEIYNSGKIRSAVGKAFDSCNEVIPDLDTLFEYLYCNLEGSVHVEEIQDLIENWLMDCGYNKVAKAYILYRDLHKRIREDNESIIKEVAKKLKAEDVKNQNANVDEYSFGGRSGEALRIVTKNYALNHCMSKMARNNHLNNMIYIHDLDSYAVGMHNCLTIPFDDLLKNGFKVRQTDIRPASSISTALQLVAVLFQVQSLQQFGGVAASHLDWTLVPYFRLSFYKHFRDGLKYIEKIEDYDKGDLIKSKIRELSVYDDYYKSHIDSFNYAMEMTQKELYQAVEGFYHNLNSLQSRSGNQLPFSSINYGTCTLPEGQIIIEAIISGSIAGVGKFHKTPIFPCGIFQYMKGVNDKPDTPNYYLYRMALKSTSLRLYPNYANVDWSGNAGYDKNDPKTYFATMGCRTANGFDINGLGQQKDGRGNICPVTIILPTLAMMANRDVDKFMVLLDKKIGEAKDMLIERFEWICNQSPSAGRFMYENNTMAGYVPEEGIRSALKHGTLAIGQLGLAETLQLLVGENHLHPKGMELAKKIEHLFQKRAAEFKQMYHLNFGVYYTPAENLCHTALINFRKKYGVIPNVSDREYFTNSIHVPVWENVNPFEKIDIESQLTGYSSAGCITYVELPSSAKNNIDALEELVNYAMSKDIPYFAINVPNDTCEDCGYTDDMNDICPMCGSHNIKHLRRVTGYLTNDYITSFNKGKVEEVKDRVKHVNNEIC